MKRAHSLLDDLTDLGERFMVALVILVMSCILIISSFFFPDIRSEVLVLVGSWVGCIIGFYFSKNGKNGKK